MKKYLLLSFLILCVMIAFVGCGQGVDDDDALITISSDGKEIYPIVTDYDIGKSWVNLSKDDARYEDYENVPEVIFERGSSVKFSKNVSLSTVYFRKEGSEDMFYGSDVNFNVLDKGCYYADIIVEKKEKLYSCALKLIIPEKAPAPIVDSGKKPIVSIQVNGKTIPAYAEMCRDETGYYYATFDQRIDEVKDRIPVITWSEGIEMKVSKGHESWGTSLYDISGEFYDNNGDFSELHKANGGDYYFRVYVVERHKDGEQDYKGYNCVFRMAIPDLDPFVTVISNGVETVAPKYWYCSVEWNKSKNGSGWVSTHGEGICGDMEENFAKLPEVVMSGDFSISYGERVDGDNSFFVYDENCRDMGRFDLEGLKNLNSGTYYVVVDVFRYDTEMHEGERGYNGYQCGFKLVIPE